MILKGAFLYIFYVIEGDPAIYKLLKDHHSEIEQAMRRPMRKALSANVCHKLLIKLFTYLIMLATHPCPDIGTKLRGIATELFFEHVYRLTGDIQPRSFTTAMQRTNHPAFRIEDEHGIAIRRSDHEILIWDGGDESIRTRDFLAAFKTRTKVFLTADMHMIPMHLLSEHSAIQINLSILKLQPPATFKEREIVRAFISQIEPRLFHGRHLCPAELSGVKHRNDRSL